MNCSISRVVDCILAFAQTLYKMLKSSNSGLSIALGGIWYILRLRQRVLRWSHRRECGWFTSGLTCCRPLTRS